MIQTRFRPMNVLKHMLNGRCFRLEQAATANSQVEENVKHALKMTGSRGRNTMSLGSQPDVGSIRLSVPSIDCFI
jgi:hypothetical protein